MATNSRKHRGYRSQKVFAEYIKDIFPYAEPTGAGRQGRDILSTPGVWFELKARAGFDPRSALKQAHKEAEREAEEDWVDLDIPGALENAVPLPVAILRMNGQGEKSIGEWVACMRVDTLKELLKEAGYGASVDRS